MKKFPLQRIIFEITQECNLECQYCYNYWRRTDSTVPSASFSDINKTLNRLFKSIDFSHIIFTGGEPFMVEGIKEHVLKCRMKGKSVTLISNGTLATVEDYHILSDLGVAIFEFPLLGNTADIHDSLTGRPGSFNKVLKSIHILKGLKSEVCTVFVLTKKNVSYLPSTLELAVNLGVKRFMLARFNIGGRGIKNIKPLLPSLSEIRDSFDIANEFDENHPIQITANVCIPLCILDTKEYPNIPISSCGANIEKMPITVDYKGNMRICNHSPTIIGNIFTDEITSIFSSEYIIKWKETCPVFCRNCNQWFNCRGGCRASSEQMGKSLFDEDPIIEMIKTYT